MKEITHKLLLKVNRFPIQAILFSRKLYDKYGGINEQLPGQEDWELWIRYSQYEQFTVIPKTTSLFRLRDISLQNVDKNRRQKTGSRYFCESLFWASQPKQAAKT